MSVTRYDEIGVGYATTRREDPRLAAAIVRALGPGRSVVNVGAGAGSYEPDDRHVIAIEPSDEMAGQRPAHRVPAIRAFADALPLRTASVDAALAVLTVHHWDEGQREGIGEMRRVARGPVVIVTIDPERSGQMWLMADYLPEVGELDRRIFPNVDELCAWLGPDATATPFAVPADTCDWTLLSFWAHPERVLDPAARAGTSGFARMPDHVVARVVADVERDLADGTWDARHGHLRSLDALDVGLRIVVSPGST